jgi:hypothetical protein
VERPAGPSVKPAREATEPARPSAPWCASPAAGSRHSRQPMIYAGLVAAAGVPLAGHGSAESETLSLLARSEECHWFGLVRALARDAGGAPPRNVIIHGNPQITPVRVCE